MWEMLQKNDKCMEILVEDECNNMIYYVIAGLGQIFFIIIGSVLFIFCIIMLFWTLIHNEVSRKFCSVK